MTHRPMLGWMLLVVLIVPLSAAAGGPTTAPTTQPARVAGIKQMVGKLANDNYQVREAARVELMGLNRAELPLLRKAVKQSLPLEPSQLMALQDIVTQVYLSGADYDKEEGTAGFLGISMASWGNIENQGLLSIERGIAVVSRVPGFSAFRMLQPGDVILAMDTGTARIEFKSPNPEDAFSGAVKAIDAGTMVKFEVLRQGQIIDVPVMLSRRPRGLTTPGFIDRFNTERANRAEDYWEKDFATLLGDPVI
jgi:hypothetical protein